MLIKLEANLTKFQGLMVKGAHKKLKNEVANEILANQAIRQGFEDEGYTHANIQEVHTHNCWS